MRQDTLVLPFSPASIDRAAKIILARQPVAIPTETVYGLAADATSAPAVRAIFEAKGRPSFNPLIVHVLNLAQAEQLIELTEPGRRLAAAHWPGPLTLVARARHSTGLAAEVRAGLPTLAVRVPAHPAIRMLLDKVERPLAAPSANRSGRISPTTAAHVMHTLRGVIPLVIDAGPTEVGLESTIIGVDGPELRLLRPGCLVVPEARIAPSTDTVTAPGQLQGHYAPAKPMRLNVIEASPDEWHIGFGDVSGDENLSEEGSIAVASAKLYSALHRADASSCPRIAIAPLPAGRDANALNDRLNRAAVGSSESSNS